MKAYFTLPNEILYESLPLVGVPFTNFRIQSYKVGGIEQLTVAYNLENPDSYIGGTFEVDTTTTNYYDKANCTQLGIYPANTSINSCAVGVYDSYNPFAFFLKLNYSNIVGGFKRGEIVNTISGNPYGIESLKFGFDKVDVPVNDLGGGGSSGATIQGAFYLEIDQTQDFYLEIKKDEWNAGGKMTSTSYIYTLNVADCSFDALKVVTTYFVYNDGIVPVIPTTVETLNIKSVNWLSGGRPGWVTPNCTPESLNENCDPIVTQSICFLATAPKTPAEIFGDLVGCCYISPVLAHLTENDEWKNDVNSFLLKRNFDSETIDLILQKNGVIDIALTDNTYGQYYNFGSLPYPNYKGYRIDWQNVLQVEGEGNYRLKAISTLISGIVIEYSIPFKLQAYTENRADGTVRIQSIMNGYLRHRDFDFKGLNWVDGLRVNGFFGNRQPEYEQEHIIYANRQSVQLRSEMINNYTLQTMHVPCCITDTIIEYHNFANSLKITDYNRINHCDYVQKEVVFDSMENIEYKSVTKYAPLLIKYKDLLQNFTKSNC